MIVLKKYMFDDNKKSNLSDAAKTVHQTLTPFYDIDLRKKDKMGLSIMDVVNKMSRYGSMLAKDLPADEYSFFEKKVKPLIAYSASKIVELRTKINTAKENESISPVESNVKVNFLNGLNDESFRVEKILKKS